MNTCKNCNIEIPDNRKYCSLKCRNIYVNLNIRDYSKLREYGKKTREKNIEKYEKNPKYCIECKVLIPFTRKHNKFCSHTCSANYSNAHRNYKLSDEQKKNISIKLKSYYDNNPGISMTHKRPEFPGLKKHHVQDDYKNIIKKYMDSPNKCKFCDTEFNWKNRNNQYCNRKCRSEFERKDIPEFRKYQFDCKFKFSLATYPNEFDFNLIKKYGWYKAKNHGNNLNGISRDHMYSMYDGFINNIPAELLSHPANCKLVRQKENSSKWKHSSITLDELKERIDLFNKKYNLGS